ncbi:MAG TPA: ACT domain-containing protein [Prolixibacteraceae bacterium]|nr:ACT domain-containing protein [Prolixibacteraceae bacterium]
MIIKQLSVFLENRSGRLNKVSSLLGEAGINMTAFTIADTNDYGILRVIVTDPEKALAILKENDFLVKLTDVVMLKSPNKPGALARALHILETENIPIEYMYAFSIGDSANIVIRPANVQKCIEILRSHEVELMRASELYKV